MYCKNWSMFFLVDTFNQQVSFWITEMSEINNQASLFTSEYQHSCTVARNFYEDFREQLHGVVLYNKIREIYESHVGAEYLSTVPSSSFDKIFSILSNVMGVCSIDKNRWMNDSYMVRWNVVNELEKEIKFLQEKLARSNRVVKYLKEENEQLRSYFGDVMECDMVQIGALNEAPY